LRRPNTIGVSRSRPITTQNIMASISVSINA
jgi:hypothetical protein